MTTPYLLAVPCRTSIDTGRQTTRVRFEGAITGRDIIAATDDLIARSDFDDAFDQLWVFTDVTSLDIAPEVLREMVAHDTDLVEAGAMGRVKVAIVVSGELRELAAKLYQRRMEPSGQVVRLFRSEAEAEDWLREGSA